MDDTLSSPQRHQQHTRQVLRQLAQNVEESLRRRSATARPQTPTPLPGHVERIRANRRSGNRVSRTLDLQSSPRRRQPNGLQSENAAPTASTLDSQTTRVTTPTPSLLPLINCNSITRQHHTANHTRQHQIRAESPLLPPPATPLSSPLRPLAILPTPPLTTAAPSHTNGLRRPSNRTTSLNATSLTPSPSLPLNLPLYPSGATRAPNARSLAQRRRRERERNLQQRVQPANVDSVNLPTPPLTQVNVETRIAQPGPSREGIQQNEQQPDVCSVDDEDIEQVYQAADEGIQDTADGTEEHNGLLLRQRDPPAQRAERRRRENLFLAARKPYRDPPQRHDLGLMDVPCPSCSALHWMDEKLSDSSKLHPRFGTCCMGGKVQLPTLQEPPEPLRQLLTAQDQEAVKFRDEIWKYNRAFAFTSLGVSEDHSVNEGRRRGPPVFRIFGELHHLSGALESERPAIPRYAQLFLYEPRAALEARVYNNADLNRGIMQELQTMLEEYHQYVPVYRHAHEILQQYDPADDAVVRLRLSPGLDRRRYNLPTADEVAVILPGNQSTEPRDIVLRLRSGPLYRISDLHPAYTPLQYPLLFPRGENGWYPEMLLHESEDQRDRRLQRRGQRQEQRRNCGLEVQSTLPESRRLTLTRYVAHRIHFRSHEFNPLHHGGRLFTRYVVDMFASADQQRLSWILRNQPTFRAARFNNLEDAAAHDEDNLNLNDLGQCVILPSSYIGGPRNMAQGFQDSMAIARYFRKVDIFLTVTTNPHWTEIERELLPGQTAYDRPDLVARVFQLKKKAIVDHIYKHGIFSQAAAYVYTIEFQKRGLPHMHCLIFLKEPYKLLTPEDIDSCISACWPDPELQPLLFDTVKRCMVHGPCGADNPNAQCMKDGNGKCAKHYPKDFQEFTTMDGHGYPLYRRPNDGRAYEVGGKMVDNRNIVPYPPFLCGLFDCHINIECAISLGTFKYAFKYIQKGPDRASLEVNLRDEVKQFIDGRYISAPDAVWRIFHYELHEQIPNVVRLQVHLPDHHMVVFNPHDNIQAVLECGAHQRTTLTAFFEANADSSPLGEEARKYIYQEFPQHFVYDSNKKKWKLRKKGFALGRMYFIKPTAGEQFYLRTLLTVVKGPKSFEDLRRVPGQAEPLPTFYAACLARGLLEDDGEWRLCLQEACEMQTGTRLRHLFATLLLFGELAQPNTLWNEFRNHICDDLEWRLQAMEKILGDSGHSLANFPGMPQPQQDWTALTLNPLIAEQLNYNRDAERTELDARLPTLNDDQRAAYTRIIESIEREEGKIFFLNGPGGTGKTYVYNTICAKIRSEGKIILCISSSGISALLIRGGRTAHSMFKIPIDTLSEGSVCGIPKDSSRADLLRSTKAIIWDEIGAQHRHAVEAVDRTFRDICNDDRPFAGITVVLGGDFLQTLPVVPKGSREDIVDATIQRSHLWENIEILFLQQNMRLQQGTADVQQFSQWLLEVGHGQNMVNNSQVRFPEHMRIQDANSLINTVYPAIDSTPPPPPEYFLNRMILAPRNADVGELNQQILEKMSGNAQQYISADEMLREAGADPQDEDHIPIEFLRSINSSSLPPGELNLKVGCPIILLRNLSPSLGLCNGTWMIVTRMRDRVLEVRLIGGEHDGEIAMIPRITLTPSSRAADVTFRFKRRQFPVRLAFALSINKSQGQSVKYVGLDVRIPVFAHGQLYVALSRATSSQNIKILLPDNAIDTLTSNVVYEEVLLN
ncbi:hypothetical protein CVT25_008437 [Psilocybe cyanescens]|uniref:ATP-dependent DNA helicase n=1 Tax=Psilocybe cyanescens TaxID=93625 RepID=A0A409WUX5_PSICY|nr:hypothetical protein CVT25_008437 [Psilocybe cyanescens]